MQILVFVLFFVVYLFINVVENYYREKWRFSTNEIENAYWSKAWHHIQWLRWTYVITIVLLLIVGFTKYIFVIIPLTVLWWILYDGILNLLRKREFFYQSKFHNLSALERYATKSNKLILLIISVCLFLIIKLWL